MSERTVEGACMCGAVRVLVRGEPFGAPYCHCKDCRKATGAPVSLLVGYEEEQVQIEGTALQFYESSPGVHRSFCGRCGTSISYQDGRLPGEIYIHVGVLDDPASFEPTVHSWHSQRLDYMSIVDDLPRHRESSRPR
ncbi:MAG TPA: GFA family protein [Rubrobacteraceae bacterium]|nr:GFA family protein [Rubrobacteraceae bacterium]